MYSRLVFCQPSPNLVAPGTKVVPVGRRLAAMVSTCRNWFTIHDDSLRVAFECVRFHTKVIQSRDKLTCPPVRYQFLS